MESPASFLISKNAFELKKTTNVVTHTSMGEGSALDACAFHITDAVQEEFFDYYEKQLTKSVRFAIVERHKKFGPIVIDLDFRYNDETRKFDMDYIMDFLEEYTNILSKYVVVPENCYSSRDTAQDSRRVLSYQSKLFQECQHNKC